MASSWLAQAVAVVLLLGSLPVPAAATDMLQSGFLYDWGFYGLWPRTWFQSSDLAGPRLNFLAWDEACAEGFYLFSPRGSYVSHSSPVILDARGNLVWTTSDRFGDAQDTTDFKIQNYHGQPHITFWAGNNGASHRYGMGSYYMLDETYQVVKVVEAVETRGHNLRGDIHEFHITPQDTALMTIYYPQPANLSAVGGPSNGWVLDSIFQEVDLDTGDLLFEWRASEHIPVSDSMRSYVGSDLGGSPTAGFDYFHINSVDKDHLGNYIISARHSHQIVCISPQGETLWILGGKSNMFQDLSDGRATDFTWQHHARWHGNNTLSMFDNAKTNTGGRKYAEDHSRGLVLTLDTQALTAAVLHDYYDPQHPKQAESQGSMQMTDLGSNVLVDYGFYPAVTEFSKEGNVLCDVRLAPWLIWKTGMVTSYRGFKTSRWIGRPWYNPVTSLTPSDGVIYVSWNGATEVASWVLQGSDWSGISDGVWQDLDVQAKDGFEASFDLTDDMPQYLRVAAVDKDGALLKASQVVDRFLCRLELMT
ncbi:ASST-domain-containing protein [Coniella lustricola]|uniref:ASST-domain-containing protein n=1 Tax=Coniella lustricola TaxID=2025994 RepID=A0A2T2ZYG8_9PEZI|nr:ASST-domain-containing protein [Coniella lustricola]